MRRYLKLLLQIFLAPQRGWEDVSAEPVAPDTLLRRGFIPLAAVAALARLMAWAYHGVGSVTEMLLSVVVEFGAYFAGYFIAVFAVSAWLPRVSEPGREASECVVRLFAVSMAGLMACVGLLRNVLPSDFAIVNFLYVYLAIIAWRAEAFMRVAPGRSAAFVILAVVAVIIPPLLIMML